MFYIRRKNLFPLVCVLLLLSSCVQRQTVHGYLAESPIRLGERKEVVKIMSGDPTLEDGETWYYVRIATRSDLVGIKKSYSSTVIKVVFLDGIVKDIQKVVVPKEKLLKITKEQAPALFSTSDDGSSAPQTQLP